MRYRKMDENGDFSFGHGAADFYRDVPEAPAQAVKTRLHLRLGEWFLDTSEGTAYSTKILGKYTESSRDAEVRNRISGTQGVTEIVTYSSSFDPDARAFAAAATINTLYGTTTIEEGL